MKKLIHSHVYDGHGLDCNHVQILHSLFPRKIIIKHIYIYIKLAFKAKINHFYKNNIYNIDFFFQNIHKMISFCVLKTLFTNCVLKIN